MDFDILCFPNTLSAVLVIFAVPCNSMTAGMFGTLQELGIHNTYLSSTLQRPTFLSLLPIQFPGYEKDLVVGSQYLPPIFLS